MPTVNKDLATSEVVGTINVTQLFAGDSPVITSESVVASGAGVLAKYTVLGKVSASGKLVPLNPAASDGSQVGYGILSQPVDATSTDVRVGTFIGGTFNDAALVWPAALTTLAQRKAVFDRTPIVIGTIRL